MNFRHEGDPALYYGYEIFQVAAFRAGFWRMVRVSVPSDEQREVVSALSGVPRAKASRRTGQGPSRGTFDRGDLKEWPVRFAMELLSTSFAMSHLQ